MAPLALKSVSAKSACCPQRAAVTVRAPRVVVFAEPRFSLGNNERTADGYVEKDTAGQSNMYPTVMKPYEAGSASDTVQQDNANNAVAVGGSVIALGAIGLGLTALVGSGSSPAPADTEDFSQYLSLSAYSATFEQELAPRRAPAPVAEVLPAPEVAAEVAEVAEAAPEVAALAEAAPAVASE